MLTAYLRGVVDYAEASREVRSNMRCWWDGAQRRFGGTDHGEK